MHRDALAKRGDPPAPGRRARGGSRASEAEPLSFLSFSGAASAQAALPGGTPPQGRFCRHFTRPGGGEKLQARGGRTHSLIGAPHAGRCPGGRGAPAVGPWAAAAAAAALRRLLLPQSRAARTGRSRSSAAAWAPPRRPHGGLRAAPALAAAAAAPRGAAPVGKGRLRGRLRDRRAPRLAAFGRQVRGAAPTATAAALPPPPPARGGGQRPARPERRRRPRADTAAGASAAAGSRRRAAALRGQEAAGPGASRALETDRYRPRPSRPAPRGFGGAGRGGGALCRAQSGARAAPCPRAARGRARRPARSAGGRPCGERRVRVKSYGQAPTPPLSSCLVLEGGKAEVGEVRELSWCWFPPLCVRWARS